MTDLFDEPERSLTERIDSNERTWKILIAFSAVIEVAALVTYLLLMDFGNRLHLLILIAAILVYWTLAGWTWALHVHSTANAQRILRALQERQKD